MVRRVYPLSSTLCNGRPPHCCPPGGLDSCQLTVREHHRVYQSVCVHQRNLCLQALWTETVRVHISFAKCLLSHRELLGVRGGGSSSLHLPPSPPLPRVGLSCTQTNYPLPQRVTCTWPRLTPALCMKSKRVLLLHDVTNMQVIRVFSNEFSSFFVFLSLLSRLHPFQGSTPKRQVSLTRGTDSFSSHCVPLPVVRTSASC